MTTRIEEIETNGRYWMNGVLGREIFCVEKVENDSVWYKDERGFSTGVCPIEKFCQESTPVINYAAELERLKSIRDDLVAALKDFIENPQFSVAVGGNPIRVEQMIAKARAAIAKATQ